MPMIYESPDGGGTIYAREFGQTDRQMIKGTPKDHYDDIYLWHDIRHAAKTNPALQDLLDQAVTLYRLTKEDQ